ncbi:MAG: NAD(P)/FAD-dependent oxidoreductase [Acidimicrobiia bacterium]|nr:NAD(P)/FAD-dependent oxidoreductase [Acidimicrobiia bacterium]
MTTFDVIVIGAGPAGENAAARAASHGLRTAIVERELAGGECSYWACMPSKALLRPGEALAAVRRVPGAAAAVTGDIDVPAVFERRDALAANFDDAGQVTWITDHGVEFLRGHGRLDGQWTVLVTTDEGSTSSYAATRAVVIATGTGAFLPPVPGLSEISVWDNRQATTAEAVPHRLLIVGGGVVGVEMAQAWKTLGSAEVTVVEMMPRLLPREEPFAGEELREALEEIGVTVLTGTTLISVSRDGTGPVTAVVEGPGPSGGGSRHDTHIGADEIVIAAGRRPHTDTIGLDTVGLTPGDYIDVNDQMQASGVSGGWLYAVGDVNGRALLTHTGKYQARIAGDHIGGRDVTATGDLTAVPRVVFTDPQVAAVGLTEQEARDQGLSVRAVQHRTGHVAGASVLGRGIKGTSQLVIDENRRVVIGATFVGPGTGELLHAATIAIVGEVPIDTLWHAIPSFPTLSEVWLRLLEAYGL